MSKPKKEDIDKQGGLAGAGENTPESRPVALCLRTVLGEAKELANAKVPVDDGATVEAVGPVNVHSLTGIGMKPGDVRQHD